MPMPKTPEAQRLRDLREAFEYATVHGITMAEARRRIAFARWRARDAARDVAAKPAPASVPAFQNTDSDEGLKWFQR